MKQAALFDLLRILDRAEGIVDEGSLPERLARRYGINPNTSRRWPAGRVPKAVADRILAERVRVEYKENARTGKIDPEQRPLLDGLMLDPPDERRPHAR